jgi:hypothetical protein
VKPEIGDGRRGAEEERGLAEEGAETGADDHGTRVKRHG